MAEKGEYCIQTTMIVSTEKFLTGLDILRLEAARMNNMTMKEAWDERKLEIVTSLCFQVRRKQRH